MKAGFWKKDWFLGLMVTLAMLLAGGSRFIQGLERTAYDWGVLATTRAPSDRIAVIAIDEASIRNIGRWPWPRDVQARMIDALATAKAKVIGYTVFFSEPQIDPGQQYINKLLDVFPKPGPEAEAGPPLSESRQRIFDLLREAEMSAFALVAACLIALLPGFKAGTGAAISAGMLALLRATAGGAGANAGVDISL